MKFLNWTMPGGEVTRIVIRDGHFGGEDFSPSVSALNKNRLRRILSSLHKINTGYGPSYGYLSELMLTFDGSDYRLWIYTRNWPGRSSYLAGILAVTMRGYSKNQRKRYRRKKKANANPS